MFCPQCHVEYRPGFTHCIDCDVDLVSSLEEAMQRGLTQAAAETGSLDVLLWSGTDADFYLSLLRALEHFAVGRLGRAVHPPLQGKWSDDLESSFDKPEFGVWVSEQDRPFAEWILNSERENDAKEKAFLESGAQEGPTEEEKAEAADQTGYVCPLCRAQFLEGYGECPNCGAPLRPAQGFSEFDGDGAYLPVFDHPQFAEALCTALQRARIPFENSRLIGTRTGGRKHVPLNGITVLASDEERARRIFTSLLARREFYRESARGPEDPRKDYWPARAEKNRWLPEDLAAEVWSGTDLYKLLGVGGALREFEVAYSIPVEDLGRARILVHPEDEERAREIVREVEEGPPPE